MRSGKRWDKKRNEDLTNEERRRIEEMRKNKRRREETENERRLEGSGAGGGEVGSYEKPIRSSNCRRRAEGEGLPFTYFHARPPRKFPH